MYYGASWVWKYKLPTDLIQIAIYYTYNLKQLHILVTFGLRCSETPSFLKAVLKKLLPVWGGGTLAWLPPLGALCLIRPADQVQFYDSPFPQKRLPTPGLDQLSIRSKYILAMKRCIMAQRYLKIFCLQQIFNLRCASHLHKYFGVLII